MATKRKSKRDQYDIACGMRGPDFDEPFSSILKQMTASVVRYGWGLRESHKAVANISSIDNAKKSWDKYATTIRADIARLYHTKYHYRSHFEDACIALGGKYAKYRDWLNEQMTIASKGA